MDNKIAMDLLNMIEFENAECNLGTWYHGIDDDMKEALDMAIKALEQEPCDKYIKEIDHLRKYICKLETQIVEQQPCEDCISRQAVLDINEHHHGQMPNHVNHEIWKEIKALPSVTLQFCEDAVSRQAVLEGLASIAKTKAKSDAQKSMMGRMMFFVEQLPSVSTEKTGRWIRQSQIHEFRNYYKCSVCGKGDTYLTFNFCQNCGAKMSESEE